MLPSDYQSWLAEARQRIEPHIHRTPVLTSRLLNERAGCTLFFKCENFQRMGAFKMRGATNAVLSLTTEKRARGVVTHSSGNFAQALALAASAVGTSATIVMPHNAPEVKKAAVRGYGGHIVECEPSIEARQQTAESIVNETGATFLHPYDDPVVVAGQATAAAELLEDAPDLAFVIAPIGGGGLISGTAIAADVHHGSCQVYGAEPEQMNDAYRSLEAGQILDNPPGADTIADGLKTNVGKINFPIIQRHVKEIICVSEMEIVDAMRLIWERMKIVVEPSAAVPYAAILKQPETFRGQRVGLMISGGNVDLSRLPF